MFIPDREEPFVVFFFPFFHFRCLSLLPHVFQLLKLFPRARQQLIVDVLFRRNDKIVEQLVGNRQKIAANPVKDDARRDVNAKGKRNQNRQPIGDFLRHSALFPLERIDPVLRLAEDESGNAGGKRPDEAPAFFPDRDQPQSRVFAGIRDLMDHGNQPHQDDDLRGERDHAQQRMVMLLLEDLLLFLGDRVLVAEMLDLDPVHQRHDLYHGNGVLLAPQRERKEQNFRQRGKKDDRDPVVAAHAIA